jgi:Flp pilus assembly protein TadG
MRGALLNHFVTPRRGRGERGAALVEFAISIVLLLTLLFGIISYGYVLSFKQGLTQAAAEGARAAAVGTTADAVSAVTRSVTAFDKTCNSGGLTCQGASAGQWPPLTYACPAPSTRTCVKVTLSYDWKNHPLLPKFPGLGLLLPDTLTSTRVAEVS